MHQTRTISAGQFFCMLYVSNVINILTNTPGVQSVENMQNIFYGTPLILIASILLCLPILFLHRRHREMNLIDMTRYHVGKWAAVLVAVGYSALFLYNAALSIARYNVYIKATMLPRASVLILSLAVVGTACYGAFLGIEALARAAGLFFIGILASLIFIFCALVPEGSLLHFSAPGYYGTGPVVKESVTMVSGITEIATMVVLLPYVRGKIKGKFVLWGIGETVTIGLVAFFVIGVLGDYTTMQLFPFHVASTIAKIGSLQRLDALHVAVWTTGLYIKVALFLLALSVSVTNLSGKKAGRIALLVGAAIALATGMLFTNTPSMIAQLASVDITIFLAVVFFALIPLAVLLTDIIKEQIRKHREKLG